MATGVGAMDGVMGDKMMEKISNMVNTLLDSINEDDNNKQSSAPVPSSAEDQE